MSVKTEIFKHSGYLMAARLFVRLASLPFMLYMAATLKPELFGMIAFVLITVEVLSSIGDVGLTRFGARALIHGEMRKDRMVGIFLSIQLMTSVVLMLLAYTAVFMVTPEGTKRDLFLVAFLALFFSSFIYTSDTAFTAERRFGATAVFQVLGKVVYLTLGFTVLFLGYSVLAVITVYVIAMAVEGAARMLYLRARVTLLSGDYSVDEFMHVVRGTLPFAVTGIAVLVYYRVDTLILGLLKGDYEVGIYSAAYSFFTFFFWLPVTLSRTLLPGFVESYKNDRTDAIRQSFWWYRNGLLGGIAIAFAVTVMSRTMFELLLPDGEYDKSVLVLQLIIWSVPFLMMVSVGLNFLIASGYEKRAATATVIMSVAIILIDLALIPRFGVNGAAVAMVTATALWALQHLFILKRNVWCEDVSLVRLFAAPLVCLVLLAGTGLLAGLLGAYVTLTAGLAVVGFFLSMSMRAGNL